MAKAGKIFQDPSGAHESSTAHYRRLREAFYAHSTVQTLCAHREIIEQVLKKAFPSYNSPLTNVEMVVAVLHAQGVTLAELARTFGKNEKTVQSEYKKVREKLGEEFAAGITRYELVRAFALHSPKILALGARKIEAEFHPTDCLTSIEFIRAALESAFPGKAALGRAELPVFLCHLQGLSPGETAAFLNKGIKTVESQITAIHNKLGTRQDIISAFAQICPEAFFIDPRAVDARKAPSAPRGNPAPSDPSEPR